MSSARSHVFSSVGRGIDNVSAAGTGRTPWLCPISPASCSPHQEAIRMDYVESVSIRIAKPLYDFVNSEVLPGTSIGTDTFWRGFAGLLADLAPRCKALLDKR